VVIRAVKLKYTYSFGVPSPCEPSSGRGSISAATPKPIPTGEDAGELRRAFRSLERRSAERYVSDGDPRTVAVPGALTGTVDEPWWTG
jgi:hypothetical protein